MNDDAHNDGIASLIKESLAGRAGRDVRSDGLHDRVLRRSRQLRRRRRAYAGMSGAGLAAAVAAGMLAAPGLVPGGPDGRGIPSGTGGTVERSATAAPRTGAERTTLPPASGAPGAAERPSVVGRDPAVLHFDLDLTGFDVADTQWTSGNRYESVTVRLRDPGAGLIQVYVGPDPDRLRDVADELAGVRELDGGERMTAVDGSRYVAPPELVTVGDRPGWIRHERAGGPGTTAPSPGSPTNGPRFGGRHSAWIVQWQPVDGLHAIAQAQDADRAAALRVAAAVRLDRAQRCAVPARVARVRGAWTSCSTRVRARPTAAHGVWVSSRLVVAQADGDVLDLFLEPQPDRPDFRPTHRVAGYRAAWVTANPRGLWIMNFGPAEVFVGGATVNDPALSVEDAAALVEQLRFVGDLADPRTWPARAIPLQPARAPSRPGAAAS